MLKFIRRIKAGQILANKKNNNGKVNLNVGCGTDYKNGWINIDNNSDHNIKKLDLNWDLRHKLPLPDNSVDFIFNEHFLKHLNAKQGVRVLKDFWRILKTDGVLRIATPDLKVCIDNYSDDNWRSNPYYEKFKEIGTKAELLNISFHNWGHQYLYDQEELNRRLKEAGFKEINFCEFKKSGISELSNLETRDALSLIAEAKK
jgi:predicted SAM-dependent methyltransferase